MTDKRQLRLFGIVIGCAFIVVGLIILLKRNAVYQVFIYAGVALFTLGIIAPVLLKPFYFLWMKLALLLGRINTFLILSLIFFTVMTPLGAVFRLFGRDVLNLKKRDGTYWVKREERFVPKERYEKPF